MPTSSSAGCCACLLCMRQEAEGKAKAAAADDKDAGWRGQGLGSGIRLDDFRRADRCALSGLGEQWLRISLKEPTRILGVRLWNYNKSAEDTYRGVSAPCLSLRRFSLIAASCRVCRCYPTGEAGACARGRQARVASQRLPHSQRYDSKFVSCPSSSTLLVNQRWARRSWTSGRRCDSARPAPRRCPAKTSLWSAMCLNFFVSAIDLVELAACS